MCLPRVVRLLGLSAAILAIAAPAHASPHEVYWQSGAGYFSSPARVIAGYGGGPGYRYHLSDAIALHAEARWLAILGNASSLSAGGTYEWRVGAWHPAMGLQVTAFLGDQVRVVSSEAPDPPPPVALALQARLAPLRFVRGTASATVLGVDLGAGIERGKVAPAVLFSLLEVGYRF